MTLRDCTGLCVGARVYTLRQVVTQLVALIVAMVMVACGGDSDSSDSRFAEATPVPSPTLGVSPAPSATPQPSPEPTSTPVPTAAPSPSPGSNPNLSPTPTPTPTSSPVPSVAPSSTPTPSSSPTPTPGLIADAGADQGVTVGDEVVLDGSASQGPIAQFSWQQLAGPVISLAGANTSQATFTAPVVEQQTLYSFELTVEDAQGNTATDAVDVVVSPVATKACGQKNETSADVVFVVDRSGSMSSSTGTGETRLDAVKRTAPLLLNQFGPTVRSAVVSFNSSAVLNKELTNDHDATLAAVDALFPSGGTDATDGFQRALDALSNVPAPAQSQSIVFLTDGDSNASAIAQSARDSGITVYAIGYFLDQSGEARIRDQVSQPAEEFYFSANDEQTLETAFSAIGRALRPRFVAFSSGSVLRVESGFSGAQPIIDNVFLIDDNDPNAQESDGGEGSLGMQPISLPLGFLTVDLGLAEASAGGQFDDARTQGVVSGRSALASVAIDFGGLARLEIGAIDARSTTSLITGAGLVPQADELGTTARLMLPGFEAPMPLIENQPLDLGFVELVVGERVEEKSADRASLTVNGVRLRVGGEEGGELVIGQAVSSIDCSPEPPASSP